MLWKESANHSLEDKNSHHMVLKIKFYWNTETAICWCIILACLCATTAKVSSCNRHSIAHKPYNIFCLDLHKKEKFADSCPKETEVHRAQWHKNNARQSEEKSRGWQGRRKHWGDAERKGWGRQVCRGRWGEAQRQGLASQATWKGGQPQKAEHAIFRNHLQELTDLSANPGVHQTAPETSVQLCTPGWSRVPGEKMLSGKIPGSMLGKQRQTHGRESKGRLDARKLLPPGLCGHTSWQRESSMWP